MKKSIFFILFLFSLQAFAQEENKDFDIRFGIGRSILGSGDMRTTILENELNYRINRYFTSSASLGYGRSNWGVYETASYLQGNLNIFISPFKNTGKNDLRIGTGLSLFNVSDARILSETYGPGGELIEAEYDFDVRSSYGYNIMLEDTYTFNNKFLLGVKLFTQPYFNGDLNSGILLKLGVKL